VNDHPDKVATSAARTETHLAPKLREVVDQTKRELFLFSPYFVPGKKGVELLAAVHRRGARVVVITNSLASTDGVPVHSKYQLYRKPLLQAGVELYEIKPTAGALQERRPNSFRGPTGSGSTGLHAKTFAFDRRVGFIGSYNLDPRSNKLNTEMGVLFDCPLLARRLPQATERDLARNAYRGARGQPPRVGDARGWKGNPLRLRTRGQSLETLQGPRPELAADRGPALIPCDHHRKEGGLLLKTCTTKVQ
jgi:cardiolipin synthase C